MIGQFKGRQKTNVYGWVSDLAVARSGFYQIGFDGVCFCKKVPPTVLILYIQTKHKYVHTM